MNTIRSRGSSWVGAVLARPVQQTRIATKIRNKKIAKFEIEIHI